MALLELRQRSNGQGGPDGWLANSNVYCLHHRTCVLFLICWSDWKLALREGDHEEMERGNTFTNTRWGERFYTERNVLPRLSTVEATNTFYGVISGEGVLRYAMIYTSEETGFFTGLQTITGSVDGHRGSFTLREEGAWQGTRITSTMTVIEGSGTDALPGISGTARYTYDGSESSACPYTFDFTLDRG